MSPLAKGNNQNILRGRVGETESIYKVDILILRLDLTLHGTTFEYDTSSLKIIHLYDIQWG
jgi:hypothetical protein